MPSEFRYRRRVQFADTDLAGVVHFSWIVRYMEEAEHALWREAGLSIAPADSSLRYPRVGLSVEFKAPLRFEDEFEVAVRITAISQRSIAYSHELTCGGRVVATGTMTVACVEPRGDVMVAVAVPDEVRNRLRPWTSGGSATT